MGHLDREKLLSCILLILIISTIACNSGDSEIPTMPPSPGPTSESTATPYIVVTFSPSSTLSSNPILETLVFPENGFSIVFFPDWQQDRLLDEIIITDPTNPLNTLIIQKMQSQYGLSWVDEQISESLLETITAEYPDISTSLIYPAQLGSITNGRAFDYVISKGGEKVFGGMTVGTQEYDETWVVQWQIASTDYADLSLHFFDALNSFTPLSD